MTIAIAVRSDDGLVLAADRQATWPGLGKTDEGKVALSWKAEPFGALGITGSGASSSLAAVSADMFRWFKETPETDEKTLTQKIEELHCELYERKVLPFASSDIQRADYFLIIGYSGAASFPSIWTTDGLTVNVESSFAAVGVGALAAQSILSKLWVPLPTANAITLAAFVIHEVKATVDGCGLGTDIVAISRGRPWIVDHGDIEEMEKAFKLFRRGERVHFHECMGHVATRHSLLEQLNNKYKGYKSEISALITRLASQRLKGPQ